MLVMLLMRTNMNLFERSCFEQWLTRHAQDIYHLISGYDSGVGLCGVTASSRLIQRWRILSRSSIPGCLGSGGQR